MTLEECLKLKFTIFLQNVVVVIFCIYVAVSLNVLALPKDILRRCETCREFVNFMKRFFPNIEVFSSHSPISEVVAFYTSYMWIMAVIFFAILVISDIHSFIVGHHDTPSKKLTWLHLAVGIAFLSYIVHYYYSGNILGGDANWTNFTFESRFETLAALFSLSPSLRFAFMASYFFCAR